MPALHDGIGIPSGGTRTVMFFSRPSGTSNVHESLRTMGTVTGEPLKAPK